MRVYTCMFIHACLYMHVYTCVFIHACLYMRFSTCVFIHTCLYMRVYTYFIHACLYMCVYTCVFIHACLYMHVCTWVFIHACLYLLYTCVLLCLIFLSKRSTSPTTDLTLRIFYMLYRLYVIGATISVSQSLLACAGRLPSSNEVNYWEQYPERTGDVWICRSYTMGSVTPMQYNILLLQT